MKPTALVLGAVLMGIAAGCHPSTSEYRLSGFEGFHPGLGYLTWLHRSALVVIRIPRDEAGDLEYPDKAVLCFSKQQRDLAFSKVARSRPAEACDVYVPAEVVGYGGDTGLHQASDPVVLQPDFPIEGPWLSRDAQRHDQGIIKDVKLWVQLAGDGRITKGTIASVSHRPGNAIAPK